MSHVNLQVHFVKTITLTKHLMTEGSYIQIKIEDSNEQELCVNLFSYSDEPKIINHIPKEPPLETS